MFLDRPLLDLKRPEGIAPASRTARADAAAYTPVDKAEREPDVSWAANAAGVGVVARAAALGLQTVQDAYRQYHLAARGRPARGPNRSRSAWLPSRIRA